MAQQIEPWRVGKIPASRHIDPHGVKARRFSAACIFEIKQTCELIWKTSARCSVEAVHIRRRRLAVSRLHERMAAIVLARMGVEKLRRVVGVRDDVGRHRRVARDDPRHQAGVVGIERAVGQHAKINRGPRCNVGGEVKRHALLWPGQRCGWHIGKIPRRRSGVAIRVHRDEDARRPAVKIEEPANHAHAARVSRLTRCPYEVAAHGWRKHGLPTRMLEIRPERGRELAVAPIPSRSPARVGRDAHLRCVEAARRRIRPDVATVIEACLPRTRGPCVCREACRGKIHMRRRKDTGRRNPVELHHPHAAIRSRRSKTNHKILPRHRRKTVADQNVTHTVFPNRGRIG